MIIVGIDPGSHRMGYARVAVGDRTANVSLLEARAVDVTGLMARELYAVATTILAGPVDVVAIETPGGWLSGRALGGNGNVSMKGISELYQAIGIIRAAAEVVCGDVRVITDSDVKYTICGHKSAKKYEVHRLLPVFGYQLPQLAKQTCSDCRKHGYEDKHSADAADAISIAHAVASSFVDVPAARPIKQRVLG